MRRPDPRLPSLFGVDRAGSGTNDHRFDVELLTEIIKAANVSSDFLMRIIGEAQISPNWAEIPLPAASSPQSRSRPAKAQIPAFEPSRKRPLSLAFDAPTLTPTNRTIHPRPTASGLSDSAYSAESQPKRKRGRPTNEEKQARAAAAAAAAAGAVRGEDYAPPKGGPPSPLAAGLESATRGAAPDHASAAAAIPALLSAVETGSETSTGQKKRGRPSKADIAARNAVATAAAALDETASHGSAGVVVRDSQDTMTAPGPSAPEEADIHTYDSPTTQRTLDALGM
ncbi:hypothetical protein LTR04_002515 [Oleoguttula sp. CCFEE 6159]|nr:hypothetical protein LTR04_002515 [Oleoguttula sp. CCFEE 6159]